MVEARRMTRRKVLAAAVGAAGVAGAAMLAQVDRALALGREHGDAAVRAADPVAPIVNAPASTAGTRLVAADPGGTEHSLDVDARGIRTRQTSHWNRSSVTIDGRVEAVGSGADAAPAGPMIVGRGDVMGIYGSADGEGPGVKGSGSVGVEGVGTIGISGRGDRGGVLAGQAAQLRLEPSDLPTHPRTGEPGDLFVDRSRRLWFCAGGSDWRRVA